MGSESFYETSRIADVQEAFSSVVEAARFEHGHGGYTGSIAEKGDYLVIQDKPLSLAEAEELAGRMIDADDHRVSDKWGPAGAIPLVLDTRRVDVTGFAWDKRTQDAADAVKGLVKLAPGESVESIELHSCRTDRFSNVMYGCAGTVVIAKPAPSRTERVTITLPVPTEVDKNLRNVLAETAVEVARSKVRLRKGERVTSVTASGVKAVAYKVAASAPTGKAVTRFVIGGSRRHATWKEGFATQAEARAALVAMVEKEASTWDLESSYEVQSVTRREDGSPLVKVNRRASKARSRSSS